MSEKLIKGFDIVNYLEPIAIFGDVPMFISGFDALNSATEDQLAFCMAENETELQAYQFYKVNAGLIVCDIKAREYAILKKNSCLVFVTDPKLAFIKCINKYFPPLRREGIAPSAIIERDVILSTDVYIGPLSHIGEKTVIGRGTTIESRVSIGSGNIIGRNVLIQQGSVIGSKGQGMVRNHEGKFEDFQQMGAVVIEDDVEIGANTVVVKGTFGNTMIGRGSKVGNLCNIGHNVRIGEHVFLSAGVIVAGSVRIDDHAWIAPGVIIRDSVNIGENAVIGMGSIVTKDIADHVIAYGIPARKVRELLND